MQSSISASARRSEALTTRSSGFENLRAVCQAAGGDLKDIVKLNVFLTDLTNFPTVNEIMAEYFSEPYPARAAIGVGALPKGVGVEMDAVMVID